MLDSLPPRIGLALGSGAARGWAHIGVLRALGDLGIVPEAICGTSMGALIGGFYLSGDLRALEDWARTLTKLRLIRYLDFKLSGNGFVAGHRLFSEMERHLQDKTIEDLAVPFASVGTDLDTGHEVWLTQGRLVDAIRASFSLPAFFEPVQIGGRWLIDGALVNPVPVSVCRALGARMVIAVNVNGGTTTRNIARQASALKKGDVGSGARGATPPGRLGVMASTFNIVQDRVNRSRMAADPPDVSIVPKVNHVGLLEFHRAEEAIAAGEAATRQAEAEIRESLAMFATLAS